MDDEQIGILKDYAHLGVRDCGFRKFWAGISGNSDQVGLLI